jgi:4-diphosphocytidyl-2-C-methyl-D-erythritol kinase
MSRPSVWPAPAKLNLFLHVIGRRDDGYHELETLFQLIDLEDEIEILATTDGRIERGEGAPGVAPDQDLAMRAARLLRARHGNPTLGARISVRKRIPMGGGLGGGSSDAATVLVALNALWALGQTEETLAQLGRELGADVPVFVRGRNAIAFGIGDRLEPIDLPPKAYAIVFPGVGVATATIFQAPELTRNSPTIKIPGFPLPGLAGATLPGRNDLEPVVVSREPAVRDALGWLGRHGAARMTGSGACVFLACDSREAARAALVDLPKSWQGFVAEGLPRSSLHERLERRPIG